MQAKCTAVRKDIIATCTPSITSTIDRFFSLLSFSFFSEVCVIFRYLCKGDELQFDYPGEKR